MSKKLLLADDSITIQKVVGITFAQEDYELSIVDNGDAALAQIRTERPDLILADILMPGENGYEVCSAVKQDPELKHIPVLLLTGTFEPFDEGKARAVGADSWIAKPFESQVLLDRVAELLARAPAVPEPPAAIVPKAVEEAPATEPGEEMGEEMGDWSDLEISAEEAVAAAPDLDDTWEIAGGDGDSWDSPAENVDFWEEAAKTAEDDLWGRAPAKVSAEVPAEDDWSGVSAEINVDAAEGDQGESVFTSEPEEFVFQDEEQRQHERAEIEPVTSESADGAGAWAEFEEDILPLDDSDIIEEEALEEIAESAGDSFSLIQPDPDEFLFEEEPSTPAAGRNPFEFVDPGETADSEGFLFEEEAYPLGGDLPPVDEPEWDLPPAEEFMQPAAPDLAPEPSGETDVPPPVAQIAPAQPVEPEKEPATEPPATGIEEKLGALSDEEITRIVERVAGPVLERVAQAMLEKIAWEVVPDLAEGMIREEIRKIRESVAR